MSGIPIQQMAERVAALMEERLGVRGQGLAEKMRRGGRLLPRPVRRDATILAEAAVQAQNPKLLTQIDHGKVALAYDASLRYLRAVGRRERRIAALLGAASSVAGIVLVTGAAIIAVLVWRGYL